MSGAATPTMPGGLGQPSTAIKRKEVKGARKARRLGMLPDDIRNLVAVTLQKKRPLVQADDLYKPREKNEQILEIPLAEKVYQIKIPPISEYFLKEYGSFPLIMEKFGEHAIASDFLDEDVQQAMRGIMKYYMFHTNYTFSEEDLKMSLMFEEMDAPMLSYIDEPNLFGYWIYNHWNNLMYFFKLEFVAEDNIRPTTSKNKAERIKKDWGLPVGYKTLKDEFRIAVDAVEFQKMLETLAKGDMRSLRFEQNKPYDIPSDLEGSVVPFKTPKKKVRTRPPPSLLGGGSNNGSDEGDRP